VAGLPRLQGLGGEADVLAEPHRRQATGACELVDIGDGHAEGLSDLRRREQARGRLWAAAALLNIEELGPQRDPQALHLGEEAGHCLTGHLGDPLRVSDKIFDGGRRAGHGRPPPAFRVRRGASGPFGRGVIDAHACVTNDMAYTITKALKNALVAMVEDLFILTMRGATRRAQGPPHLR
jgi:hypothetical protein